jgi:hypothetical protein
MQKIIFHGEHFYCEIMLRWKMVNQRVVKHILSSGLPIYWNCEIFRRSSLHDQVVLHVETCRQIILLPIFFSRKGEQIFGSILLFFSLVCCDDKVAPAFFVSCYFSPANCVSCTNPKSLTASVLQRKSRLCIPFLGRSLSPNFHIHVFVSDLYIPRIGPHTHFPAAE